MDEFKRRFRNVALILDDLQFISGKERIINQSSRMDGEQLPPSIEKTTAPLVDNLVPLTFAKSVRGDRFVFSQFQTPS